MLRKWIEDRTAPESNEATMKDSHDHVLDPGVIASLRDLGGEDDPELFAELVGLFLDDTPKRLEALCSALEQQDPVAVEQAAHALKSSAANLGAFALSDLLRQIECAGKDGDLTMATPLVERTDHGFGLVQKVLQEELG